MASHERSNTAYNRSSFTCYIAILLCRIYTVDHYLFLFQTSSIYRYACFTETEQFKKVKIAVYLR